MNTVLTFIQDQLKSKHSSVSRFLESSSRYNRSSFYRLMNEPFRISEEDILYISQELKLSDDDVLKFRSIIKGNQASSSDERLESIPDLVFTKPDYDSFRPSEVEFISYPNSNSRSIRSIKTYNEVISDILLGDNKEITIKIRNCISSASSFSMHAFFDELRKKIVANKIDIDIHIEHIITIGKADDISKLILILKIAHNIMFCDYNLYFLERECDELIDDNHLERQLNILENTMTIHVNKIGNSSDNSQDRSDDLFFVFNLSNTVASRDYCLMTSERLIYDYYSSIFEYLKTQLSQEQRVASRSAADINMDISNLKGSQKKVLFKCDPCLDSIVPKIWKEVFTQIDNNNQWDGLEGFRKKLDPNGIYSYKSNKEFFQAQMDYLYIRFHENEKMGLINIYYTISFLKFIKDGVLQETQESLPAFSVELRKIQLLYMIKCISKHYGCEGKQQFYFFKRDRVSSDLFMYVWDNECLMSGNVESIDMVATDFLCRDKKIASLLYGVILDSLQKDIILSKEESIDFLKWLFVSEPINGTEQEIEEYLATQTDSLIE